MLATTLQGLIEERQLELKSRGGKKILMNLESALCRLKYIINAVKQHYASSYRLLYDSSQISITNRHIKIWMQTLVRFKLRYFI